MAGTSVSMRDIHTKDYPAFANFVPNLGPAIIPEKIIHKQLDIGLKLRHKFLLG